MPPPLTALDLGRRRLHTRSITLVFSVVIVVLGVTEIIFSEFDLGFHRPVSGVSLWADALSPTLVIGPVFIWFWPRNVLAWGAGVTWVASLGSLEFPGIWKALSISSVLALLWLWLRPRFGRGNGPHETPGGDHPVNQSHAVGSGRPAWIALVMAALLTVGLLGGALLAWAGSPEHPSLSVMLAGFVVPLLVWPSIVHLSQLHRRLRLCQRGGAAWSVRVVQSNEGHYLVPVDSDTPVREMTHLKQVLDGRLSAAFDDWLQARYASIGEQGIPPVSDDQLGAWADDQVTFQKEHINVEDDPDEWHREYEHWDAVAERDGPHTAGAEAFTMIGAPFDGATVAIVRADGCTWLGEVREQFESVELPQDFALVMAGNPATPPPAETEEVDESPPGRLARAWERASSRSWIRWATPFLIVSVVGPLLAWGLTEDVADTVDNWFAIPPLLILMLMVLVGTSGRELELAACNRGILRMGFLLDDVLARDRVAHIAAGEHAVALRLRDPDGSIIVTSEQLGAARPPHEFAQWLQAALDAAPINARSGRRPSPALLALALLAVIWVVGIPALLLN